MPQVHQDAERLALAPPETARKIMKPTQDPEAAETVQTTETPAVAPAATCSASLVWHAGPARGGGGTAQREMPVDAGYSSWWTDGDLLLVIVDTNSGPFVRLVKVNADGDMLGFDDPDTGDDNFGYMDSDISWWARIEESLPQNAQILP